MKTFFPVVVGKLCLRWRKCFWHFLSRPIVGSPILLHSDKSSLIQDRSDQWVHLGHVASKPEQPTTNSN